MSADIDRGSNPRSRGSRCGAWKRRLRPGDTLARRPGCRKKGRRGKTQYDPGRSRGNGVYSPRATVPASSLSRVEQVDLPRRGGLVSGEGRKRTTKRQTDGRTYKRTELELERKYTYLKYRACARVPRYHLTRRSRGFAVFFACDGLSAISPACLTGVARLADKTLRNRPSFDSVCFSGVIRVRLETGGEKLLARSCMVLL